MAASKSHEKIAADRLTNCPAPACHLGTVPCRDQVFSPCQTPTETHPAWGDDGGPSHPATRSVAKYLSCGAREWLRLFSLPDLSSSLKPRCDGTHLACSFSVQELSPVGLQNKTKIQPCSSLEGHHLHLCWDFLRHSRESWTAVQKTEPDFCGHQGRAGPGLSLHLSSCPYAQLLPHKYLAS